MHYFILLQNEESTWQNLDITSLQKQEKEKNFLDRFG